MLRGDSAEELSWQQGQTPKHASPLDDLAPQAGTVGIELVDQSFITQVTHEHFEALAEKIEDEDLLKQPASEGDTAVSSSSELHATEQHAAGLATTDRSRPETSSVELQEMGSAHQDIAQDAETTSETAPLVQTSNSHLDSDRGQGSDHATPIADSEEQEPLQGHNAAQQDSAAMRELNRVWYKERPVQLTIAGYTLIAFLYNCSDELIPLFAAAPPSIGGVGLLANQLAVPLIVSGIVLMWYAMYGYPWFQRNYGAVISCRIGLLATAPFILLIPVAHYASASVAASQVVLCVVLACKAMAATNSFSASMILVNNAAPMHALGKVNGTGQMLASFVRAIGPALAGVVWGSTASLGLPGAQFISFSFVAALACLTQFVYVFLKMPMPDK